MRIAFSHQGKIVPLQLANTALVEDAKVEIAKRLQVASASVQLRYASEMLEDDAALLASYHVKDGSGLTVTLNMHVPFSSAMLRIEFENAMPADASESLLLPVCTHESFASILYKISLHFGHKYHILLSSAMQELKMERRLSHHSQRYLYQYAIRAKVYAHTMQIVLRFGFLDLPMSCDLDTIIDVFYGMVADYLQLKREEFVLQWKQQQIEVGSTRKLFHLGITSNATIHVCILKPIPEYKFELQDVIHRVPYFRLVAPGMNYHFNCCNKSQVARRGMGVFFVQSDMHQLSCQFCNKELDMGKFERVIATNCVWSIIGVNEEGEQISKDGIAYERQIEYITDTNMLWQSLTVKAIALEENKDP